MVIREDKEESSTAHEAEDEASPGVSRSEGASRAEALKTHGAVLKEAAAMGLNISGLTAEGLCANPNPNPNPHPHPNPNPSPNPNPYQVRGR